MDDLLDTRIHKIGSHSDAFWEKLHKLKQELSSHDLVKDNSQEAGFGKENDGITKTDNLTRDDMLYKIENVVADMVTKIVKEELPAFSFNTRGHKRNTRYNAEVGMQMVDQLARSEVSTKNAPSIHKFSVMLKVLSECHKHIQSNTKATKRDIYYLDVNFFQGQNCVDEALANVACMMNVPRRCLHVISTSKGLIAGNLIYKDEDGSYTDCSKTKNGLAVPTNIESIESFYSEAKFALIVEKEASFQRLMDCKILSKLGPCILITGKGFPDINTRMLVKKLHTSLSIPMLALVDCDPHGIEIMSVYRFGSKALSFEAHNLTCTSIRWIGVLPSDISKFEIPEQAKIPFSIIDKKKLADILRRPYISNNPGLKNEVELLQSGGYKAEIQCLDTISLQFLIDVYLHVKLRTGSWL